MSVILEFSIDGDDFALGCTLGGHDEEGIELEQIIPLDEALIPFFWVEGGDAQGLQTSVGESTHIENLTVVDRVGAHTLYRADWTGETEHLLEGVRRHSATILEAHGSGEWYFRLRFPDHESIGAFHAYCGGQDIPMVVERVFTPTETPRYGDGYRLSSEQREAIELALERDYFAVPRGSSLSGLATDLGVSQQAVSERIQRGTERVLRSALR